MHVEPNVAFGACRAVLMNGGGDVGGKLSQHHLPLLEGQPSIQSQLHLQSVGSDILDCNATNMGFATLERLDYTSCLAH
jgi:hypothetical protein